MGVRVGVQQGAGDRVHDQPPPPRPCGDVAGGVRVDRSDAGDVPGQVALPGQGVGGHHHLHLGQAGQVARGGH
ncbi:MAG: hypothetical protein ACLGIA_03010, partial [Actinomycetes bacterium]